MANNDTKNQNTPSKSQSEAAPSIGGGHPSVPNNVPNSGIKSTNPSESGSVVGQTPNDKNRTHTIQG